MIKTSKTPWPTKDAMQQVYDMHLWGGNDFDFYSGDGSHNLKIVEPYIDSITTFLKSQNNPLTVCDLGCGDFNIGKQLTKHTKNYIAVDIVDNLIERNKALFKEDHLEFQCLDIVKDELPKADVVILRQVLQHLSNAEIQNVVEKLSNYKYVILTEHLPLGEFVPNKDIISGQGIRIKKNSGVDVLEAPFNLKIVEERKLSEIFLDDTKGKIVTLLFKIIPRSSTKKTQGFTEDLS
ncbi:class I SAM-dependent methyltransferase [Winogradskyella thalassocola]|uniref:Methyltransferase domain-containing protein n=1 Tax=Winogradskyella thalassocola TaxID=262004 RepID=A0A1G8LPB0_9FLAO|nr:class I SAM-dependent methyltransferase [Winogradskyella thalassocola]SDI57551.1 Methyltransferase domain-containing protein [Winogradskyella thalassocola]